MAEICRLENRHDVIFSYAYYCYYGNYNKIMYIFACQSGNWRDLPGTATLPRLCSRHVWRHCISCRRHNYCCWPRLPAPRWRHKVICVIATVQQHHALSRGPRHWAYSAADWRGKTSHRLCDTLARLLRPVYSDTTQLNSTQLDVELSLVWV